MGYGFYVLPDGREAGYGVEAECDQPGCTTRIDRGLDYLCGDEPESRSVTPELCRSRRPRRRRGVAAMAFHETRDPYAPRTGVVEMGIASPASSGDQFLDMLTTHLRSAESEAEKASSVAASAEKDLARASGQLTAVRAACDAYREATSRGRDA